MPTLRLPAVVYDDALSDFLTRLGWIEQMGADSINVDFQDVQFHMPGALTALLSAVHHWCRLGREVRFVNAESAPAFPYLQRMDFFTLSGLNLPESFVRRGEHARFVTLHRIDGSLALRPISLWALHHKSLHMFYTVVG